jgi:periplasmic protein CpxP/Spy
MKKLILSTLSLILSLSIYAHQGHSKDKGKTAEEKATLQADRMKEKLTLTDIQRTQFYNAALQRINKIEAIKLQYKDSANKKGMGQEIKAVKQEFDNSLATFLTADQMAKYKEIEADKKEKMKEKNKNKKKSKNKKDEEDGEED